MRRYKKFSPEAATYDAVHWDERYAVLDIEKERTERTVPEYVEFLLPIAEEIKRQNPAPSCIETGCGTAPLAYVLQQHGFDSTASDFSEIICDRLRREFGRKAIALDCADLSKLPAASFDLVVLAGTVYNNENYFFPTKVFNETLRVLKPGGCYVQFLNVCQTPAWRYSERLAGWTIRTFLEQTRNGVSPRALRNVLALLKWRLTGRKYTLYWAYDPDEVAGMLEASGFDVRHRRHMQVETGFMRYFPVLGRLLARRKLDWDDIDRLDCRDPNQTFFNPLGVRVMRWLRKRPHLCGRSYAFAAFKPSPHTSLSPSMSGNGGEPARAVAARTVPVGAMSAS